MEKPDLTTLRTRTRALWERYGSANPLDGLFVTSTDIPTGPFHGMYQPSLIVVLQGAKVSRLGPRSYRYDAGQCLIASLDVPILAEIITASAEEPYIAFALNLDPGLIAELVLEQVQTGSPPASIPAALSVHPLPAELVDPLARLLDLADQPRDISVLAPLIRREITWRLLHSPQGAILRQIGLADSRLARIGRSIGWVRENFTETLSVAHLAALAGMSSATFHRHFKAATAMTPVQFQKKLRLQEARRLLLSEGYDVGQVGFMTGYESPSQFSREYRRMFGAPPGRDSADIRNTIARETHA